MVGRVKAISLFSVVCEERVVMAPMCPAIAGLGL